jgi:hypothetical protein
MSRPRWIIAIPLLAVALGLTACGAESSGTSSSKAEAPAQAAAGDAMAAPVVRGAAADAGKPGAAAGGVALPDPGVKLVKTADLVVEVERLNTAAARVRALAEGVGGAVSSETTSYSDKAPSRPATAPASDATPGSGATPASVQPGESVLVLRVPVARMDQTLEQVAGVGKELWRTSSSVDVTADLADLGSRVKTAQASVERVRALLARAGSVQEIVSIEAELTRRESDLEALEARQAALSGRADLSTLTVTLRTPEVTSPVTPAEDNGFRSGLRRGWHAVVVSTGILLTVLGALLPLAVVAAIIGLPVWWGLRRRSGRRRPAPATAPGTPPNPPPGRP